MAQAQHPTLINLPPPPSDPVTPSDVPGTPNSTTTSMSELSTVAIKDGHRGHLPHHAHPLDAERADRISRLAGLERVATARSGASTGPSTTPTPSYFDANNQPQIVRERSTVGSASATGSVGGRTTWASGSDVYDPDKMSEDQDAETASSVGGFSDEAASLVGFGEGARTPARQLSSIGSPIASKVTPTATGPSASAVPPYLREQAPTPTGSPMSGVSTTAVGAPSPTPSTQEARMIDGMTYDPDVVDTVNRTPPLTAGEEARRGMTGTEYQASVMHERDAQGPPGKVMGSPTEGPDGKKGLGQFYFEDK